MANTNASNVRLEEILCELYEVVNRWFLQMKR